MAGGRTVETSPLLSSEICKTLQTKTLTTCMAVTHVQSQSQEVGSGDEGLGLLCFDLSSAETDFSWLEDEQ